MCYGIGGIISKKEIKRNRENLKGRYMLPIFRIFVEAGFITSLNNTSRENQNSKGWGNGPRIESELLKQLTQLIQYQGRRSRANSKALRDLDENHYFYYRCLY